MRESFSKEPEGLEDYEQLEQEMANFEELDLDDDDMLFELLDEMHERNIAGMEERAKERPIPDASKEPGGEVPSASVASDLESGSESGS
eukprot:CAMPEP_0113659382 /NCGR_PEP_ID=MMETSP0017_2-20120614/32308_1 /TAXON_ID=2856 /ORGANISM="Cylindrotheca closterium" /LENGTH=88 /DNA_ID=CAMNT_0000573889 /DNA_START=118 /DNA_END=380 /DNA_ORIENTATION=+ /assembly_acc=CAM_ASM_000147